MTMIKDDDSDNPDQNNIIQWGQCSGIFSHGNWVKISITTWIGLRYVQL